MCISTSFSSVHNSEMEENILRSEKTTDLTLKKGKQQ